MTAALDTSIFTSAALVTFGIQAVGFLVAYALQTEIFYDILGGINYLLVAFLGYYASTLSNFSLDEADASQQQQSWRLTCMTILFFVSRGWLLGFLAWRAHHRKGDSRFDEIKENFVIFFLVWMIQGCWVFLVSWPLFVVQALDQSRITSGDEQTLSYWDILTCLGFGVGVIMEIVADIQKTKWVAHGRQGGFCTVGLWKFSRRKYNKILKNHE